MSALNGFSRCALAFLATASANAQTLALESKISTPEVPAAIIMPVHCDANGSVFVQPPISKIGRDGRRNAVFDLSVAAADGLRNLTPKAFAVGPMGDVYVITKTVEATVIVIGFDPQGGSTGATTLETRFEPMQLGAFRGGGFLGSGVTFGNTAARSQFVPFVAVFDRNGRQIAQVITGERPQGTDRPGRKTKGATRTDEAPPPEFSVVECDGSYCYLLRQADEPTVFVISAAGQIERTLRLSPPGSATQVSGFRVGAGQLLVEYVEPRALPNGNASYSLALYNATDGEKISEYWRDPGVSGTLACTDWRGDFTFLSGDEMGSVLLTARAR